MMLMVISEEELMTPTSYLFPKWSNIMEPVGNKVVYHISKQEFGKHESNLISLHNH
jgi:hypothetical protein